MYAKLTIPERLKDLRVVDKHLTLEQLAEQTGLSKSALGKYETDDYKDISPFAIATLADFYGVSADYLMGLTDNKEVPNADVQSLHYFLGGLLGVPADTEPVQDTQKSQQYEGKDQPHPAQPQGQAQAEVSLPVSALCVSLSVFSSLAEETPVPESLADAVRYVL